MTRLEWTTLLGLLVSLSVLVLSQDCVGPECDHVYLSAQAFSAATSIPSEGNNTANLMLYGIGQTMTSNGQFKAEAYYDNATARVRVITYTFDAVHNNYTPYALPLEIVPGVSGALPNDTLAIPSTSLCLALDASILAIAIPWYQQLEFFAPGYIYIYTYNGDNNTYEFLYLLGDPTVNSVGPAQSMTCSADVAVIATIEYQEFSDQNFLVYYQRSDNVWIIQWPATMATFAPPLAMTPDGQYIIVYDPIFQTLYTYDAFSTPINELPLALPSPPTALRLDSTATWAFIGIVDYPSNVQPLGLVISFEAPSSPGIFEVATRLDVPGDMAEGATGLGSSLAVCGNSTWPLLIATARYANTNSGTVGRYHLNTTSNMWYRAQLLEPFGVGTAITDQQLGYPFSAYTLVSEDCNYLTASAPCPTLTCDGYAYYWTLQMVVDPPAQTPAEAPQAIPLEPPQQAPAEPPAEPVQPPQEPPQQVPQVAPQEAPLEPPTDVPLEPPQESPAEIPVEPPSEAPLEPPIEPPVEPPIEPPVEPPVEPPIEPPVEPPLEPPVNIPTESPTEVPLDPPAEVPTESPIEPPIEPPAETPTEPPTVAPPGMI